MKRGSDWSPLYMLIVAVIVAILVITLVKPIFQQSASTASQNLAQSGQAAAGVGGLLLFRKRKRTAF